VGPRQRAIARSSGVGRELDEFIRNVGDIAEKFSLYIYDPDNITQVVDPRESNGAIEFGDPVPIGFQIIIDEYDRIITFAKFRGLKLRKVEFSESRSLPIATAELEWRGKELRLRFNTYTEVFAFLLRPEIVKKILGEEAEISNESLREFVTSVLQYSISVLKKGLHKHVDTKNIFPPAWRKGWRYVVDIGMEIYSVSLIGLENLESNYHVVLLTDSFLDIDRVGIGKYGNARYKLDKSTVANLPVVRKLMEEFDNVKRSALNYLDLLKIAYLGVKAYVT